MSLSRCALDGVDSLAVAPVWVELLRRKATLALRVLISTNIGSTGEFRREECEVAAHCSWRQLWIMSNRRAETSRRGAQLCSKRRTCLTGVGTLCSSVATS